MSSITWLHLSDLHLRADKIKKWDQDTVLKPLLADVRERIKKDGLAPDFIVVSGDIAFSGLPEEYALASAFFDDLLDATGLGTDRLFVVPGNHDVNLKKITFPPEVLENALVDRESVMRMLEDGTARRQILERLDGYAAWVREYSEGWLPFDDDRYHYVRTLTVGGLEVAVLGLNSAWLAHGGDSDRNRLLLGEQQVREAVRLAETADVRLAVMHHPFDWLRGFDQEKCVGILMKKCHFLLRGHLHRAEMFRLTAPGAEAMIMVAGASYESREERNAYNWVDIDLNDLKEKQGKVLLRGYSDEDGGHWAKDVFRFAAAPDGQYDFALPSGVLKGTGTGKKPRADSAHVAVLREAHQSYLRYVADRYRYLDFRGMGVSDRVPLRLSLVDMYVPLKARVELPEGETWDRRLRLAGKLVSEEEAESIGRHLSKPVPLLDMLQKHDGLVILGDPGAGKTTFLKYLTLRLAMGQGADVGLGIHLPVMVPLSAYANVLAEEDVPLDRFVARYYEDLGLNLPVGKMLGDALMQGHALFLLDGLDEVKDPARRRTTVERVVDFFTFARQKGNKFVLTSRIVGYREVRPVAEGLGECTLLDFDGDDIVEFVAKWTVALEKAASGDTAFAAETARREKTELLATVDRNPGVKHLASNPLLLTILALMKRQGVTLPERRVELYQKYVETLLRNWNLARGLGRPPTRDLDVLETTRILAPLALWMHETSPGVGLVKREELRRKLEEICASGAEDQAKSAGRFLNDVRDHASLLLERGAGTYGFIHLTFQEYLAAVATAMKGQQDVGPVVETLGEHIGDDNWHEVMLLTIGYIGIAQQRSEAAAAILARLIDAAPGKPGEAVVWAGEAVADVWPGGVTVDCRDQVVDALLETICCDQGVPPTERAAAGRVLGKLGDPRPEVTGILRTDSGLCLPDLALCYVPEGPFWMGEGDNFHLNERADRPYWIGKYPITNAQFRPFVEDPAGYRNDEWWTDDGLTWRKREERTGPRDLGERFSLPNHPVVYVTWYEALAYTHWLSARLSAWAGYSVEARLPSEAEWEKAARGGVRVPEKAVVIRLGEDGADALRQWADHPPGLRKNPAEKRLYPWEGEVAPNLANFGSARVGSTSTPGCFPGGMSPYGCEDMSGNVWEWTRSAYADYPYEPGDEREVLLGGPLRVLRGGSFSNYARYARCAARDRGYPRDFFSDPGVRDVVVVPYDSGL